MTPTFPIAYDSRGLVPAVIQDLQTHEVLMLAYMNEQALQKTIETGVVHFYSRSRQCLWKKGETSGNILSVHSIYTDCDSDAIVIKAVAAGPTCHTQTRSCFFRTITAEGIGTCAGGPGGAAASVIETVYEVLCSRRDAPANQNDANPSYTRSLLDKGYPKIAAKIAEESEELLEVLAEGDADKVVHETVDLLFHVLVGLCARRIAPDQLWTELQRRFGVSGHDEKAARKK